MNPDSGSVTSGHINRLKASETKLLVQTSISSIYSTNSYLYHRTTANCTSLLLLIKGAQHVPERLGCQ